MSSTILLLLGAVVMAGVIAAAYVAMLVFHNPFKPKWLDAHWVDEIVTIPLISIGTITFGLVLRSLYRNGVDPLVGLTIEFAFILATAALLWKWMHMRERLDAANHGLSPFAELRHIRHHQRRSYHNHSAAGMA